MNAPFGEWSKFEEYEISDGFIRPKARAKLIRFNPWEVWERAIKLQGTNKLRRLVIAPLAEIVQKLRYDAVDPKEHRPIGSVERELILNWVRENGLLGLLLQRTDMVRLAPRWRTDRWEIEYESGERGFTFLQTEASVKVFSRDGDQWKEDIREVASAHGHDPGVIKKAWEGKLVPENMLASEWRGGKVRVDRGDGNPPQLEPLNATWTRFFPKVPDAEREMFDYPRPLSGSFWHLYAEPVNEFLYTAVSLTEAAHGLAQEQARRRRSVDHASQAGASEYFSASVFHDKMRYIQPRMHIDSAGGLSLTWASPSLLASLAMMTALQLTAEDGRVIGTCERCRLPFVSGDLRAKYCSRNCKYAMQKRNQRIGKV